MTTAKSTKQILASIACVDLALHKGIGYWYFVYDTLKADDTGFYETESVFTMRLNDLTLEQWVVIGKSFVAECITKNI